jgi:hypothetical protein
MDGVVACMISTRIQALTLQVVGRDGRCGAIGRVWVRASAPRFVARPRALMIEPVLRTSIEPRGGRVIDWSSTVTIMSIIYRQLQDCTALILSLQLHGASCIHWSIPYYQ